MMKGAIPILSAHGVEIPAIGFGTSGMGNDCGDVVATALGLGYRHIDTAWKYGSERAVGEGMRASGVARDDIFLATKVSHEYLHAADFARSVDESLQNLGVDRVDLLLVHWPNLAIPLAETMGALERPSSMDSPAMLVSPTSISRCSTRRCICARSRWWRCGRSITPISTNRSCCRRPVSAG